MDLAQLISRLVLRPVHGFSVRVDFPDGSHQFWSLRRRMSGATTMARRYRTQYPGIAVRYVVVAISRADFDVHNRYEVCDSLACPGAIQPGAGQ